MYKNIQKIFVPAMLLLLTGCADIDRGLYSMSETVAPVDKVTGRRELNWATRQNQIANSNAMGAQMIKEKYLEQGQKINADLDPAAYARLQNVFGRIHAVSHFADEKWEAFLLPDKAWNAFTMGGSQIFVNKGLMDDVKSDDELAAVIGHEIAHVAANHVYEKQAYATAAQLKGSNSIKRDSFNAAYSRKDEEEADMVGTLYAALAGYDPHAVVDVWGRMYKSQGDTMALLASHPTNSSRQAANEAYSRSYAQYYMKGKINPDHERILHENAVFGGGSPNAAGPKAGEGGGLLAAFDATTSVLQKHMTAKTEELNRRNAEQFLAYVRQNIAVGPRELTANNSLVVDFGYRGTVPVKNMTLMCKVGQETAAAVSDGAILPNTAFRVEFKFSNTQLNSNNLNAAQFAITSAVQN